MYDQAWTLCERLFEVMRFAMDGEIALDVSVFAWALRPAKTASSGSRAADEEIGNNFGTPHRDSRFDDCHDEHGAPTELSVWIPLVPVTTDNGCMIVVPAQHDPLFAASTHPLHMKPAQSMPWAHLRALPAAAGDVLIWHPNLIHWGSACGEACAEPRKSIAMAFTRVRSGETATGQIKQSELREGLSLARRIRIVAKGLLTYKHWHPSFNGLAADIVAASLESMTYPEVKTEWH